MGQHTHRRSRSSAPHLAAALGFWVLIAAATPLAGCTSYHKDINEAPPTTPVEVLAIGRIDAGRTEWERAALRLERQLAKELKKSRSVGEVRTSVPKTVPPEMLVVNGTLLGADNGSDLMEMVLGQWLGGPAAEVEIGVADGDGRLLLKFTDSVLIPARTLDPTAVDPLELQHIIDELAADAAKSIIRWMNGKPFADSVF